MKLQLGNSLLLLLTAFIWGIAFVAQSVSMEHIGPFTFGAVRFLLGMIVLTPLILLREKRRGAIKDRLLKKDNLYAVKGGFFCAVVLTTASMLQQYGLMYSSVGKAGFLTTLYIVIVPFLSIFLGKKVSGRSWCCGLLAMAGMFAISMKADFTIALGDALYICAAFFFAVHIMIIDHFVVRTDGVKMSYAQFFFCMVFCTVGAFVFEEPCLRDILAAWIPVGYAGALSSGVAYTLQILGQKGVDPSLASLILSLESVFSVIAGYVILGQVLTPREIAGCAIVFAANSLAQLPERKKV